MEYDHEWFDHLWQFNEWNERAMLAAFAVLGIPNSLIDFGCGTAQHLILARDMGLEWAVGVEISSIPAERLPSGFPFTVHDLRVPLDLEYQFDMVFCWEVAEHIEEEYADVLCDTISRHCRKWLVFTAAHPEQGGNGHVNEQPKDYWIDKFHSRGLTYSQHKTDLVDFVWNWSTGPCHWLHENVMVFANDAAD